MRPFSLPSVLVAFSLDDCGPAARTRCKRSPRVAQGIFLARALNIDVPIDGPRLAVLSKGAHGDQTEWNTEENERTEIHALWSPQEKYRRFPNRRDRRNAL
jgi:hypothetical protein